MAANNPYRKILTQLRKRYTLAEIAALVGVSVQTLWRWEQGSITPHRVFEKKLREIARGE